MAQSADTIPTRTTLKLDTPRNGVSTILASVLSDDGSRATGALTIQDQDRSIQGAAVDETGEGRFTLNGLTPGEHTLRAIYAGDSAHAPSASDMIVVRPETSSEPAFGLSLSEATVDIASPGESGTLSATITPVNGFTGFISLSCYGTGGTTTLPVGVTCTFAPANLQVIGPSSTNSTGAVSANLTVVTSAPQPESRPAQTAQGTARPLTLALLLPGLAGIGLLARRRKLLSRTVLLLLLGAVSLLSVSGCAARYKYLHHGPVFGGTAAGSYTIVVTAQTSNGVTASSQSQNLVLSVK